MANFKIFINIVKLTLSSPWSLTGYTATTCQRSQILTTSEMNYKLTN